jgi:hypothetical protein
MLKAELEGVRVGEPSEELEELVEADGVLRLQPLEQLVHLLRPHPGSHLAQQPAQIAYLAQRSWWFSD